MSEVVIYQAEDGQTGLQVNLERDTVWLTQEHMAKLFGRPIVPTLQRGNAGCAAPAARYRSRVELRHDLWTPEPGNHSP